MRFASLLLLAALVSAGRAAAQAAPAAIESRIQLRDVDLACVRIIAMHGASPFVFDSQASRVRRIVANPYAGHGTGFFVDPSGIIATAAHVVAGANLVAVILTGQDEPRPAQVLYVDPMHDVAFVQVDATPPAIINLPGEQRRLTVTETVYASGFPLDVRERYPAAVGGVIGRENNDGSLYTSLAVNPGNSGGPVTDARGQLVGLVSRGSNTRAGAQGFGLLEPLRFILPGLASARELATTRFEPPTQTDRMVARVLADLVGTDTQRRLFERTPFEVIMAAATQPRSPEAAMIVAAHAWNVHIAILEHRGVRDISQLPAADQSSASQLRAVAVRLVMDAMRSAPYLRVSYEFGRSLLVQGDRSFVVRAAEGR